MESFGQRLRRLRISRSLTCSGLAHRVGITEGAIRQMESGQTKIASFLIGLRLAKELGTDAWYLATGERDGDETAALGADQLALRLRALERQISLLVPAETGEPPVRGPDVAADAR